MVGLPDERWGQLIVAYVVPVGDAAGDDGEPLTIASLDAHCRAHPMLADYKRPRAYRLVDSLPMTATGKKMHFRVAEHGPDRRRRGSSRAALAVAAGRRDAAEAMAD